MHKRAGAHMPAEQVEVEVHKIFKNRQQTGRKPAVVETRAVTLLYFHFDTMPIFQP